MASEVVTRKELQELLQYGRNKAGRVYNAILKSIPKKKLKPEFARRLPRHYIDKYLGKTV